MKTLTQEQIKEVAEMLEIGFTAYWNKKTNELLFIGESANDLDEGTKEDLKKIKKGRKNYIEIPRLESWESFKIMEQFVDELPDSLELKNELIVCLNQKHPFKHFKFAIDDSGDYREKWFDFKSEWMQNYVKDILRYLNDNE
jgi:hypothetical protein